MPPRPQGRFDLSDFYMDASWRPRRHQVIIVALGTVLVNMKFHIELGARLEPLAMTSRIRYCLYSLLHMFTLYYRIPVIVRTVTIQEPEKATEDFR